MTADFKARYPAIAQYVDIVLETPREFYMYNATVTIEEAFKNALIEDPAIEAFEISALGSIAEWLEWFIFADNLSHNGRIAFEIETLKKEEHAALRAIVQKNKVRRNPMNQLQTFLLDEHIGNHSIIIHDNNRRLLEKLVKTITPEKGHPHSAYDEFDNKRKIHYVGLFAAVIRSICLDYIKSKK